MVTLNNQRVHIQTYIYIYIYIYIYTPFSGRQSGLEGTKLQVQRSRSWRGVGNFGPEGMREHITYIYIYILL